MASGNAGKIREIARLLEGLDIEVVAQSALGVSDADETGTTFAENSLIKARHACDATGLAAIADDSGLAVDALDGRPGVYSARYAGADATDDDNIDKLLLALDGVGAAERSAAFHCVASFVLPDAPTALVAEGVWRGSILEARRGDGGFGYDPVFLDEASGLSAAELTPEQKNARSHRGQALRGLVLQLERRFS
ncbi:MAG: RdgB/HAM1 family non-canonical purine NTP pyrophosphatase [Gammaproteobacteria bacterium]|nr:RdgB/HAM1 family non-canonical purine NTP pyrophosphatase [Gammaproteobacteria bacterium]MBU2676177.1 RdgB/HAM1 family non-canonical purine NTP pyrophosphatase [Gammaproteobacteria bacterium]NNC58066.1 RdgB/HAM1 family non-canonical purine NTP pyrophosphatase [Woeseiaceae bacterium]NNL49913.1 RdgB/HAM1 family non-canonical purine NTP pyrophosphatase [Woeseiaceae bacterium]